MNIYSICTSLFIYIIFLFNIKITLSICGLNDTGADSENANQNGSYEVVNASGHSKPLHNNNEQLYNDKIESTDEGGSETDNSEVKVDQSPLKPEDFKVSTSDTTDNTDISVNNKDKYTLVTLRYGFKYSLNEGVMCLKVEYNNTEVWSHDSNEHGDKYPKWLYYNTFNKRLYVIFSNTWYYAYDYIGGNWKFNYSKSEGKACYLTLDIPDDINTIDYYDYTTRYYITRNKNNVVYFFKDHTKCVKVNVGTNSVWNYIPKEHLNQFPKSVIYKADIKFLRVWYNDNKYYSYKFEEGEWSPYPGLSSLALR